MGGSAVMTVVSTETAEDQKKRRRIQNRVNQRARRQRIKENDKDKGTDAPKKNGQEKTFSIKRWRLDEEWDDDDIPRDMVKCPKSITTATTDMTTTAVVRKKTLPELPPWTCNQEWDSRYPARLGQECALRARLVFEYKWTLRRSTGYGLTDLIHYNVFFSLISNKSLLETAAMIVAPGLRLEDPWVPFVGEPYPGRAAILPVAATAPATVASTAPALPLSLQLTPLQMATVHATWINLIPFPRMRDNLIICEDIFAHEDFVHHVVGDFIDTSFFAHPGRIPTTRRLELQGGNSSPSKTTTKTTGEPEAQGSPTSDKKKDHRPVNGMIVWGEAHDIANWEVTAEFVDKWSWALKGCDDLMMATNRWRWKRGEPPLALPLTT